jgi:hypothetical protein
VSSKRVSEMTDAEIRDLATGRCPVSGPDLSIGLEEMAGLISWRVGVWHDLGYADPPAPHCKPIPPLGERSVEAIKGGHGAVEAIDELTGQLHVLRAQLVGEMRRDEDIRMTRLDAKHGRRDWTPGL